MGNLIFRNTAKESQSYISNYDKYDGFCGEDSWIEFDLTSDGSEHDFELELNETDVRGSVVTVNVLSGTDENIFVQKGIRKKELVLTQSNAFSKNSLINVFEFSTSFVGTAKIRVNLKHGNIVRDNRGRQFAGRCAEALSDCEGGVAEAFISVRLNISNYVSDSVEGEYITKGLSFCDH